MLDRLVWAEIDLAAYRHNLGFLQKHLSPNTKMMAVLKANGYGHGAVQLAREAINSGCAYLGVVCLYEAKQLRNAHVKSPILLLNFLDAESFEDAVEMDLDITVMDKTSIVQLAKVARSKNKSVNVHLKVDTGMHRAGCNPDDALELSTFISAQSHLQLEGVFTHFATADDIDLTFARQQLDIFKTVLSQLEMNNLRPPYVHAANSAAVISLPESHFSLVRPGIATYGLSPFSLGHPKHTAFIEGTKPVLSLKTEVISIKNLHPGEAVGYGRHFMAVKPTKTALIPVGYGDGFRRAPQNFGYVLINGQRAPLLGRVSMDQSSVDVTDIHSIQVGDEVVIIGNQKNESISADDVAQKIGTINYEVVTSLAARVSRNYM